MIRSRSLTPLLLLALAGCTDAGMGPLPGRAERVPAARVVGRPEACIPLSQIGETRVRDGRTIDFIAGPGRRAWRNTLPYDCQGLAREKAFSFNTSISQLCSTDIIRVIENVGPAPTPGAACGLGQFVPIELPRRR